MPKEFLGDRKKALEESFFAKENEKLLRQMREKREREAAVEALTESSAIRDRTIVEKLVDLGLDAASWSALSLVPLVELAWADGDVRPPERDAVLQAAVEEGLAPSSPGYTLLQGWLERRPDPALFAAWGAYAVELAAQLSPAQRVALRERIVERARRVAEAAGGILGVGVVSVPEKAVIEKLEEPFA